jgi:DNA-binding CsgD family transcriptional regulator/tetratricopeptide (TPR) repeat protein
VTRQSRSGPHPSGAAATRPLASVRSGQVDDLVAFATARPRGRACGVVLTGAPGIGKSTTLEALGRRLLAAGFDARRVSAESPDRVRPFGVVTDLLGLAPVSPPRPDSVDRVTAAVEQLCRAGPVALCVDDAHRSDPDSLDALGRLLDVGHDLPVVLVLARRTSPDRPGLAALTRRPDVVGVEVLGLGVETLAELVRARHGAPPSAELRGLLMGPDTNPLRITAVLDDLDRRALLEESGGELTLRAGGPPTASTSAEAGVRAQLGLLDPAAEELVAVLATWGGPADIATIGEVTGSPAVLDAARLAVEAGVLRWTPDGLGFVHDLHRDLVLADLDPQFARTLHAACAVLLRRRGAQLPTVARQTARAAGPDAVASLRAAAAELTHAPLQAAELLAEAAAHVTPGSPEADELAVQRAGALAVAGRVETAEQVARDGLARSRDPATHADLHSIVLFSLVSAARVDDALDEIDGLGAGAPTAQARAALAGLRRWVTLLAGRHRPAAPSTVAQSGSGLVCDAIELFLAADAETALERAVAAEAARAPDRSRPWTDSPTAPVWPAFLAVHAAGPARAEELSLDARRVAQQDGKLWLTPYHLSASAGIHFHRGSWDDALAEIEAALEAAESTGTGWTSMTVATRLQIQVRRGDLAAADELVETWRAQGRPEQFGLPHVAQGQALLLEARERTGPAASLVGDAWARAVDGGRTVWPLLAGPDAMRLALAAGDDALAARITGDTAAVPLARIPGSAPAARMVAAMAAGNADDAGAAALDYRTLGHLTGEMTGWEEAACLAAAAGDSEQARAMATRCDSLASALGALTVERRLAARLRRLGIRQGVRGRRGRPVTGWESLTRTELQVAELVGRGLTSPQVAARLYISPRTVQTHISHILTKLDLRSRVELAAELSRRPGR